MIQVRLNATVRNIKTDNGTEFVNQTLKAYYQEVGISHQTSVARTPQQNGVVERRNNTLVEAAHTMLIFLNALLFLWAEAVTTACYTQNRSLIRKHHNKTLYELLHHQKPDLSYLHVFSTLCYPTNDDEDIGPGPKLLTLGKISLGLVQNIPTSTPYVPPTKNDREILFQPMFDEYLNPPQCVDPQVPAVIAPDAAVSTGTLSLTIIDLDVPSTITSQTNQETPTPVIPHGSYKEALTESFWIEAMQEGQTEFLSGILREEVYVSQLDGFVDEENPKQGEIRQAGSCVDFEAIDADHAVCQDTRKSTSGTNKKYVVNADVFRMILDICPRVEGVDFTDVPYDDATLVFLIELGYKGEDYHEYRLPIPETMLTEAIKQSESYHMFIKYSTGQIHPKKSRESDPEPPKRKTASRRVVKKKVAISADDNIISDDPEVTLELATRRRKLGKVTFDPPKRLKGVPSLTPKEQEADDTIQNSKESRKTSRIQPRTIGSNKGTGTIPGVPDESTVVSATSSEGTGTKPGVPDEEKVISEVKVILEWGSEQESEYSEEDQLDDEENDDKDGDADDVGDDHISDTQDAETKSDVDELYKYKIHVHKDVDARWQKLKLLGMRIKKRIVKIRSTNLRLKTTVPQKEETFQVVIDIIKNSTCFKGFTISVDKCRVDAEVFRKILDTCPRAEGEEFTELQNDDDTLTFLIDLGYKGPLHKYTNMYVDRMSQPWGTLAAIINKCLSEKTVRNDKLRKSRIDIMLGMFYRENVDYPELIWEDFSYQLDHMREIKSRHKICHSLDSPKLSSITSSNNISLSSTSNINTIIQSRMMLDSPQEEQRQRFTRKEDSNNIIHDPDVALELGKSISLTEAADEEAARQVHATHARIVAESAPKPAKRRSSDPSQKLKGVQSLIPEEKEAADTMKALKESKKTGRRHSGTGGSSEGTGLILGVPDEEKDISEANVIFEWGSKNESEHSDDSQLNFDDEEKKDKDGNVDDKGDDHISDTQDTDDEDAKNESDEDEIYKYKIRVRKDVDVEMAEPEIVKHENKEKDVMTNAAKLDVEKSAEEKGDAEKDENVVGSNYQVKESTEFPMPSSSLSVSSGFGTQFFNSSSDISLTGVLKDFVEADITNLPPIPEILTETPVSTIVSSPQVTPTISIVQQTTTPIPTPPISTESPTITTAVPESDELTAVQLRVAKLEKDVFELKKIDLFIEALATLKSQVPNVVDDYLGSKLGDALQKTLQKHSVDLIHKHSVKPAPESSKI
ncbi:retrovirus-related pol polyprotein from transposon TNT 1-94 [Tanacetum coccineum]